jgi:hypothetical protein
VRQQRAWTRGPERTRRGWWTSTTGPKVIEVKLGFPPWHGLGYVAHIVYHDHPADEGWECELTRAQIEATRRAVKRLVTEKRADITRWMEDDNHLGYGELWVRPALTAAEAAAYADYMANIKARGF